MLRAAPQNERRPVARYGGHQGPQLCDHRMLRPGQVLEPVHLGERHRPILRADHRPIPEAQRDQAVHPILGADLRELRFCPATDRGRQQRRQPDVRTPVGGDPEVRHRRRDQRERAEQFGVTRGQMSREHPAQRVADEVNRTGGHRSDRRGQRLDMRGDRIVVGDRWIGPPGPRQVDRIPGGQRRQQAGHAGPVERRAGDAVHVDRLARVPRAGGGGPHEDARPVRPAVRVHPVTRPGQRGQRQRRAGGLRPERRRRQRGEFVAGGGAGEGDGAGHAPIVQLLAGSLPRNGPIGRGPEPSATGGRCRRRARPAGNVITAFPRLARWTRDRMDVGPDPRLLPRARRPGRRPARRPRRRRLPARQ